MERNGLISTLFGIRYVLPDALRRTQMQGRSGNLLIGTREALLTLGLFTDTLRWRIRVADIDVSILEIGIVIIGVALAVAFPKVRSQTETYARHRTVERRLIWNRPSDAGHSDTRGLAWKPDSQSTTPVAATLVRPEPMGARLGVRRRPARPCDWRRWCDAHRCGGLHRPTRRVVRRVRSLTLLVLFVLLSIPGVVIYWIRRV